MAGSSEETIAGLKVFAKHGPVISGPLLQEAGIDNYGHFQGRITKRTRTVTGQKHVRLFTWDDWQYDEDGNVEAGQYAVTETTYRSLRQYFKLD